MSVNRVFLLGNLGKDPELRYTPQQTPVCTFSVATSERRKDPAGNWVDHTDWHNIVVFGRVAENCNTYLKKGRQAFIEGRIQTRKWQDKEGRDRYTTEIVASNVQFVGGKQGADAGAGYSGPPAEAYAEAANGGSDMLAGFPSADEMSSRGSGGGGAGGGGGFEDDDIPF